MSKVAIYIPAMKLNVIDLYCKEKGISRSELMTNCTLSFLNSIQKRILCEFQGCRQPAIGKYRVMIYNWESGEGEKTMNLCQFHLDKAKKEGASVNAAD